MPRHQPSRILEPPEADNAGIFCKNRLKSVKNLIFLKLKHRQIENNNNGIGRKFIGALTIKEMIRKDWQDKNSRGTLSSQK